MGTALAEIAQAIPIYLFLRGTSGDCPGDPDLPIPSWVRARAGRARHDSALCPKQLSYGSAATVSARPPCLAGD
ncbi:hypothetical protein E2562_005265 [Oryza meyeriana var. granulata]|uniref:Uncharacterized protein n=1 Tax=Oryza meyeriana var. granulata TaxID=110450 RepID=A0A6G1EFW0_9ORYZ|nr:hypothetical protein E2562_005265 [Oryza meyeriana var. granulata]